ncbi:hypothetical protein R4M03_09145 [Brachyspira pilosicoli]|nr:hypothetical protein [Brachyspira pilosicoli]AFR70745.1 hypothetical protein B2904_orf1408 [Brachyspira pilosicoli B2904]AGA65822.1 hypothetical protein BPP43_02520 [Brachyspira pilosicoli P43/6/78]MBW5383206.1 hypothetical protein [Brachyspira pilosicoli]MBW5391243.1 hypothetical protein [Brachyspira pilosicoli]MBW5396626.1 hypothetical protein [Brachyspira pilosicoli]
MSNKKFMIKEEKAVFADIRSAISISLFDSELNNFDGSIDMDVRRAVIYNKIVFENLSKRLLSYYASREDNRNKKKELSLIRTLKKENSISKEKLYYLENPDENSFNFLDDVLDKNKNVRGYSEYIIYSLFNHYFDYIKN